MGEKPEKNKSKYLLLLPTPHPLKTLTSYQAPTKEVSRDLRHPGGGGTGWGGRRFHTSSGYMAYPRFQAFIFS